MCDCFNMACQDKANALQLNIKVNSENLVPISQRYNAGSLRIPADPSWPKIPQRKLPDDVNNTIEPPCIIALTGTPRRSRTIVQTPLNQSPKSTITKDSAYSSFNHQRVTSSMHTLKRLPGYIDPRFKKVTNVKRSEVTSIDSLERKANRSDLTNFTDPLHNEVMSTPERDIKTQQIKMQEIEKPLRTRITEETNAKTDLSSQTLHDYKSYNKANTCIQNSKEKNTVNFNREPILEQKNRANNLKTKNTNNTVEDIDKNKIAEQDNCVKNICCSEYTPKSTMNDVNTQVDVTPIPVQENNGQLFFVLDKKLQSHPINPIQLDTITVPQEYLKQCYNLQIPVLTYQNIPMQIPTIGTNNVVQPYLINSEYINQPGTASLMKKEVEQCVHSCSTESLKQFTQTTPKQVQNVTKPLDADKKLVEEKNIWDTEKNTLKVQNTVLNENRENCLKPDISNSITKISVNPDIPEKLDSTKIHRKQEESSDSEYYIPNTIKKNVHNNVSQRLNAKKTMCNTSGEETTDSEFVPRKNIQKKECNDINKFTTKTYKINMDQHDQTHVISKDKHECPQSVHQSNVIINDQDQQHQKHRMDVYKVKTKNKSEQNLSCTKNECSKKLCRSSEPHITFKQKRASAKFSRKAKSYFQKNSHSALMDSDYTLVWPNCQYNKQKSSQTNIHKFCNYKTKRIGHYPNVKLPIHKENGNAQIENNSNVIEQSYLQNARDIDSCKEVIKSPSKTGLQNSKCKCEISPRSNTDNTIENPKGISPKTQELLNKSYWEYYNKLKHKIRSTGGMEPQCFYQQILDTPETKKGKANEVYDKELRNQLKLNPELQTLQQCSALSSMINKALDSDQSDIVQTNQPCLNGNMELLLDPMVDTQSDNANNVISNLADGKPMLTKVKCKRGKENDSQFLELKSIIFFGGMMYILIIFLPMLYDYFYHEEYDDYENMSYIEFIVDYVLSSFKEAFGGVFNGAKQILFYPVRLQTKL